MGGGVLNTSTHTQTIGLSAIIYSLYATSGVTCVKTIHVELGILIGIYPANPAQRAT
jgi:hypothetical protein